MIRDYQRDAIARVNEEIDAGRSAVLLVLPTGAGKTICAASMISNIASAGARTVFVAHRREIILQTYRKLLEYGLPVERVGVLMGDDARRNPRAVVQVASIDTLRSRVLPACDVLFIDEAHRSLAKSYVGLVEKLRSVTPGLIVVGLTATPWPSSGAGLDRIYSGLVVGSTMPELIAGGHLVEPQVFTVPQHDLPSLDDLRVGVDGDFDKAQLAERVDQTRLVGSIVEHWQRRAEGRRTIAFAASIQHSLHLVEAFRAVGARAAHVDGTTALEERDDVIGRLAQGELDVVANYNLFSEGFDSPSVKCAILARPTKSLILYMQQAGRILRPWQGVGALILDHAGCARSHGLPQYERPISLKALVRKRAVDAVLIKTCMALGCYAIVERHVSVCPVCGGAFGEETMERASRVEQVDGELVLEKPVTMAEKRTYWDCLCEIVERQGYKSGWAFHKYKERFGVAPANTFPRPDGSAVLDDSVEARGAFLRSLQDLARARGYKRGFIAHRYKDKYGEFPSTQIMALAVRG